MESNSRNHEQNKFRMNNNVPPCCVSLSLFFFFFFFFQQRKEWAERRVQRLKGIRRDAFWKNHENQCFELRSARDLDAGKNKPVRFPLWMIEQVMAKQMCTYNFCCFKLLPLLSYVPTVQIKNSTFWVTALHWSQFSREEN